MRPIDKAYLDFNNSNPLEEMKRQGIKRIYLASPYLDDSQVVMRERYIKALKACGELLNEGFLVFSPIVHCHPIAVRFDLPRDFKFWKEFNASFLEGWAEAVYVLQLTGWAESDGIADDVRTAVAAGKPIFYSNYVKTTQELA